MRIELAALTDNCEVHVRICARTLKKICRKVKQFCKYEMFQDQILQIWKMPPEIDLRNLAAFFAVHYVLPPRS